MTDKQGARIRLIYGVIFGVLSAVCAVLLIYTVWSIYLGGGEQPFTREITGERLRAISAPLWLWIALVIVGLVLWEVFPPEGKKKYGQDVRYTLYRLRKKLPVSAEGDLLADAAAVAKYDRIRRIVWGVVAAVCTVFAAAGLAYLLDFSHFSADDSNREMINAAINVLPFAVCAFALCTGAGIYDKYSAGRELPHMKRLIALGKKTEPALNAFQRAYYTAVAAGENERTVWVVRGALAVTGIVFVILGVYNGGAGDVLAKAINICTECIGLG